jgi:dimethylamine monooxygenase subunit A
MRLRKEPFLLAPRMNFDFTRLPVPFRMQPGLRRVDAADAAPTTLAPSSRMWAEKRAVLEAGQSMHATPGFDARPALDAISRYSGGQWRAGKGPLELAFEEDFAVLDGTSGTLPWLCVCLPSHWAPEEKLGLGFSALHAPVADNEALVAASRQLVALATSGECWERWVWTITPSSRYDQHPRRHARDPWPVTADPDTFAQACWLRAERQVFLPVGADTRQAVFTIRVMLQPLPEAVRTGEDAGRMHDSVASMSPAVLAYKNLAAAREPLLRWLTARR